MFYIGIVENRTDDPLKLGRCRVRVVGLHTDDKNKLPTEDLPWAVVMQPTSSAAISGIGTSPTGPVEGSTVIVIFRDDYQQHPIIIGTIAGIPETPKGMAAKTATSTSEQTVTNTLKSSSGSNVVDSRGNPVQTGSSTTTTVEKKPEIKKPTKSLVPSDACYAEIRREEGLCSTVKGKYKPTTDSYTGTVYAYQDTNGIWTIGWGNTYLADNTRVDANTELQKSECDALLKLKVDKDFGPSVQRNLKVPVTQSMFDALVSIAYNKGAGGLYKTAAWAALQTGNYEQAAALIPSVVSDPKLAGRYKRAQALFMSDGFPTKDMSEIIPPPSTKEQAEQQKDATQNPVVKLKSDTDTNNVAGSGTVSDSTSGKDVGFKDPNNVYPKYFGEPDTHRLARHEKIDQTIVFSKESARVKNVVSGGGNKWSQPPIPYNAKYPFNQIRVSESGHVEEIDDTKDNERLHRYHRSGTFEEIDVNGTLVRRIVGDDYEILERNGNVLIKGTCNVTVIGNQNILVQNDANIDVYGNLNTTVGGDINLGATGDVNVTAGGQISLKAGGDVALDGSNIQLNSGKSKSAPKGKGSASGVPDMPVLTTPNRFQELDANYEAPDEGDSAEFNKAKENLGASDSEDTTDNTVVKEEVPPEKKPEPIKKTEKPKPTEYTRSYLLTQNFTLGRVLCREDIPTGTNMGLNPDQIIDNLRTLCENCLEPILASYPNLVLSNSWRSEAKNKSVGGSTTSDHLPGCAADFQLPGFTREQYYNAVVNLSSSLPAYTQLILEYEGSKTWIHVSYNEKKGAKMERLTGFKTGSKSSFKTNYILIA